MKEVLKKYKNRIIFACILICLGFVLLFFVGMILASLINFKTVNWNDMVKGFNISYKLVWLVAGLGTVAVTFLIVYIYVSRKKKTIPNVKRSNNDVYGDANFLLNEIERTDSNELNKFSLIFPSDNKSVGWVVKSIYNSEENKTKYWVSSIEKDAHHCLVIGATASGKTQKTILQTLSYNCMKYSWKEVNKETKEVIIKEKKQPSFVVFDPKGELALKTIDFLEKNGYEILLFNLRETYHSDTWNPLLIYTKSYFDGLLAEKKLELFETIYNQYLLNSDLILNEEQKELLERLDISNDVNNLGWEYEKLRREIDSGFSYCDAGINDLMSSIFPVKDSKEEFWVTSAKNGVISQIYFALEQIEERFIENKTYWEINQEELRNTYVKVNLPSIANTLSNIKDIREYYESIDYESDKEKKNKLKSRKSYVIGNGVFMTAEATLGGIMSNINSNLNQYKQREIENITMTSELKLDELATGDRPKALFIVAPDEKETTYQFASLLVSQIYKASIETASKLEGLKLPRTLMFLLDEFGNIPKVDKFETMVTVSRSRNIVFLIAIQGFGQLEEKYGKNNKETIKENMLLHEYVLSTDEETIKYYSHRSGEYTIVKTSASNSLSSNSGNNAGGSSSDSNSNSLEKMNLLSEHQIRQNPNDMLLIYKTKINVSWVKTDAWWKSKDVNCFQREGLTSLRKYRSFSFKDNTYLALNEWANMNYLKEKDKTLRAVNNQIFSLFKVNDNSDELYFSSFDKWKARKQFIPVDFEALFKYEVIKIDINNLELENEDEAKWSLLKKYLWEKFKDFCVEEIKRREKTGENSFDLNDFLVDLGIYGLNDDDEIISKEEDNSSKDKKKGNDKKTNEYGKLNNETRKLILNKLESCRWNSIEDIRKYYLIKIMINSNWKEKDKETKIEDIKNGLIEELINNKQLISNLLVLQEDNLNNDENYYDNFEKKYCKFVSYLNKYYEGSLTEDRTTNISSDTTKISSDDLISLEEEINEKLDF